MKDSKSFWWVALGSGTGMALVLLVASVVSLHPIVIVAFLAEIWLVQAAIRNLQRLYTLFPPLPWTGRWQLRLSDMLSIVFFFGLLMAAFRALDPPGFIYTIPFVLVLGLGYIASLFFVSRMDGELRGMTKWTTAIAVLATAIFVTGWGTGMQLLLFAVVGLCFIR